MQGQNSIAIGNQAGFTNQHSNSIILNASGNILNSQTSNSTYISPIRQQYNANNTLTYNSQGELLQTLPVYLNAQVSTDTSSLTPGTRTVPYTFVNDPINGFTNITSIYRPNISGIYIITPTMNYNMSGSGDVYLSIFKQTSEIARSGTLSHTSSVNNQSLSTTVLTNMDGVNDYIEIKTTFTTSNMIIKGTSILTRLQILLVR